MKIPDDVCVLVADHGVGDHYLVAAFAEAIAARHGVRVWMAGRADLAFLPRVFPRVERYLEWPAGGNRAGLKEKEIKGGVLFDAHFPGLELMRAVGYRDFHFLDAYRCRFGLSAEAPLSRAVLPTAEDVEAVGAQLQANGITPGRFVLLGVDARSTPLGGLDAEFWRGVATKLSEVGLQGVFNVPLQAELPTGVAGVSAPLVQLRAIAMAAAGVCTVRSGLSELFCDLPRMRGVVFPDVPYWAGPLWRGTGFGAYGLAEPVREWVVGPAERERAAEEIAAYFAELATSVAKVA